MTITDDMPVDMGPMTDAQGQIFDPELHSAGPDGTPTLKSDGTFRKRRRPARAKASGTRTSSTRAPRAAKGPSVVPADRAMREQRERHVKAVMDNVAVPIMIASVIDPVDGYSAQNLAPMWAELLADYAQTSPRTAAVLDRAAGMGGKITLLSLGVLTVGQFMHNHGMIPEPYARLIGIQPRSEIEKTLDQRAAAMGGEHGAASD